MRFQDERFEYTGTGGELFKGFLLAIAIIFGAGLCAVVLSVVVRAVTRSAALASLPILVLYLAIAVIAAGAFFSAQRYRLSRTQWCGIRGGMTGSSWAFGVRALLFGLLSGASPICKRAACVAAALRLFLHWRTNAAGQPAARSNFCRIIHGQPSGKSAIRVRRVAKAR